MNNSTNTGSRFFAVIGKFLLQVLVFAVFAAAGAFLACFRVFGNSTPWTQDIKSTVTVVCIIAGVYVAALGFVLACLLGSKIDTKRQNSAKWDGNPAFFLLQFFVFIVFLAGGVVLAGYRLFRNSTPLLQDLKNPINLAFIAAGMLVAVIGFCVACVMGAKYNAKHTIINGKRMSFKAGFFSLLFNMVKWFVFVVITLGLYIFWVPASVKKWLVENTVPSANVEATNPNYQVSYYTVDENGVREQMMF